VGIAVRWMARPCSTTRWKNARRCARAMHVCLRNGARRWQPVGLETNWLQKPKTGSCFTDFLANSPCYCRKNRQNQPSVGDFFATAAQARQAARLSCPILVRSTMFLRREKHERRRLKTEVYLAAIHVVR